MEQVSFFNWVTNMATGIQLQQLIVYIVVGLFGVVAHYYKKYVSEEVSGSLWKYLYTDHPKNTVLTVASFVGTAIGYVFSSAALTVGWPSLILLAFTTGFSFDSAMNKGSTNV